MINCNWLLKSTLLKLGVIVVVVGGGTLFFLSPSQPSQAAGVPDTAEAREVMATVRNANEMIDRVYETGDLDKLDNVFIDHPDYLHEIGYARQEELRSYVTEILGASAAQNFGYLTAMKNKITHRLQGSALLKAAMEKAQAANRELTEEEWQELKRQNHDETPSLPDNSRAGNKRVMIFKSVTIDGDKARAVYDTGIVNQTALLVRINGRWYVAGLL